MSNIRERCPCCNRLYPASKYIKKQKGKSEIVTLFERGESISEISKITDKNEYVIRAHLKYHGFKIEKKVRITNKRNIDLAASLYKQGDTLESIGKKIGVSRERVRQLMKKNNVTGGLEMRTLLKAQDMHLEADLKNIKKENKIFSTYGISLDTYNKIYSEMGSPSNNKSPFFKWSRHKANAKKREITFNLSFADWWKIWEESGKWNQRGRGHSYVMARYGDSGGYTIDNVYICTSSENAADQYKSGKERKVPERQIDGKCKRGHYFDKTIVKSDGRTLRSCSECNRMRARKYYEKQTKKAGE